MQTTAIRTVANSLPENEVILLTLLVSKRYIPYADLRKNFRKTGAFEEKLFALHVFVLRRFQPMENGEPTHGLRFRLSVLRIDERMLFFSVVSAKCVSTRFVPASSCTMSAGCQVVG